MDGERKYRLQHIYGSEEVDPAEHEINQGEIEAMFVEKLEEEPGYFLATEIFDDYKKEKTETEKKEACRRIIRQFFENPYTLETFFDRLTALETFDPANRNFIQKIRLEIERLLKQTIHKEELEINESKQAVMDRWLELYSKSELYRPIVEKYLRVCFEASDTNEKYIRRLYPIAYTALDTGDPDIMRQALKILLRDTPILPGTPKELQKFLFGLWNLEDDDTLKRAMDVDAVTDFLANIYDRETEVMYKKKVGVAMEEAGGRLEQYFSKNARNPKLLALQDLYIRKITDVDTDKGSVFRKKVVHVAARTPVYPLNLLTSPEHITGLRRLFNEATALRSELSGKKRVVIFIPGVGESTSEISEIYNERREFIKDLFFRSDIDPQDVEEEKIFECIRLLFPNIPEEKRFEIIERVAQIKEDFKTRIQYLVSPRGDEVVIQDQFLNDLGIELISYIPQSSVLDLEVRIRIGKIDCICTLDSYYTLRNKKNNQPLKISPEALLLISELVLSQLRKILCEKPENLRKGGGVSGSEIKGNMTRRAHVRKLPIGQGYTPEQAALAPKDYGVDLSRFNGDLGLDRNTGQYTLVKQVDEVVLTNQVSRKPVRTEVSEASFLSKILVAQ